MNIQECVAQAGWLKAEWQGEVGFWISLSFGDCESELSKGRTRWASSCSTNPAWVQDVPSQGWQHLQER